MIILDGPMGTELLRRGAPTPAPGWSAYALDSHPELVRQIHDDYVHAGAQLHRGNTFRTQPEVFPDRYVELTRRAHELLEAAVSGSIMGSMSPIEDCYRPDLSSAEPIARIAHRKMAEALRDAGFGRIVCETFPHAHEARVA